jgi:hypothetical protein
MRGSRTAGLVKYRVKFAFLEKLEFEYSTEPKFISAIVTLTGTMISENWFPVRWISSVRYASNRFPMHLTLSAKIR